MEQPPGMRKSRQFPPAQIWSELHASPQPPQFSGSVSWSTQDSPQRSVPRGQLATHVPPAQSGVPPPQVVAEGPQAFGSLAGSMQLPPISTSGGRQTHALATQYSLSLQRFPGMPQLRGSRVRSAQPPPTIVSGGGHVQAPETQLPPPPQRLPQRPQLAGSVETSTQDPPHASMPAPQSHTPETHVAPPGQSLPQRPQFASSLETSTQVSPHTI